ncbi:MAG TPA: hypothetical protein VFU89_04680 [Rhabdochlamydiaceae bacterium]|nr:hypothetical protein [Rhabdochlamydiaceae bacterium]
MLPKISCRRFPTEVATLVSLLFTTKKGKVADAADHVGKKTPLKPNTMIMINRS